MVYVDPNELYSNQYAIKKIHIRENDPDYMI